MIGEYADVIFDGVGKDWVTFYDELRAGVKVLVVDDEPVICGLMRALLEGDGLQVSVAADAEAAWKQIESERFDLLITDKNLPKMSGVELIAKVQEEGIDLPSMVITGYASVQSVAHALAAGAADYVTKPFDDIDHVRRRVSSIVERRLQTRFYDRVVNDLTKLVTDAGQEKDLVQVIGQELFAFKQRLGDRPDVMLVAATMGEVDTFVEALRRNGHTVQVETDADKALAALEGPNAPLAAVVSLQMQFPVTLVAEMRNQDPLLSVLVTSAAPRLVDALAAVEAGASDFFLRSVESEEALEVRARRAVESSHRNRLYLHLIASLHRVAREQGLEVADRLFEMLPERQREYLEQQTRPCTAAQQPIELDLTELFEEMALPTSEDERRRHPRISAQEIEVWFRLADSDESFNRGRLRDLSLGGFYLFASPPLGRDAELEAHLLVHGDPPSAAVIIRGRVVRTVAHDPDPEKLSGNGILVDESCQDALKSLVERVAPAN